MKEKIKILKIIHLAICCSVVVAYIFFGKFSVAQFSTEISSISNVPFLLVPIIAVFASNFMFTRQVNEIDSRLSMEEKLPVYQSASIIRWAILEGAIFLILFMFPTILIFGVFLILYLISLHPSENKVYNTL